MSKAYQFPDDPRHPNPFADPAGELPPVGQNPYAAPLVTAEHVGAGHYEQNTAHRSGMLLVFGTLSIIGALLTVPLAFFCLPLSILNFGLSVPTWYMARQDLQAMAAGVMDRSGRGATRAAWVMGIVTTLANIIGVLITIWTYITALRGELV